MSGLHLSDECAERRVAIADTRALADHGVEGRRVAIVGHLDVQRLAVGEGAADAHGAQREARQASAQQRQYP